MDGVSQKLDANFKKTASWAHYVSQHYSEETFAPLTVGNIVRTNQIFIFIIKVLFLLILFSCIYFLTCPLPVASDVSSQKFNYPLTMMISGVFRFLFVLVFRPPV